MEGKVIMPLVSFVVPVYKAEKDLCRCLDSILNQTVSDWELILVDDGSPDASGKICDQYALKDDRIRVMHQENKGVSVARNNGIDVANGKWISFVDADDWIAPFTIELLIRYQERGDLLEFPAAYSTPRRLDSEIEVVPLCGEALTDRQLHLIRGVVGESISRNVRMFWGAPWGKFFLGALLKENHLQFPAGLKRAEDIVFNLYTYEKAKNVVTVLQPFYCYQMSSTSVTLEYNPEEKDLVVKRKEQQEQYVNLMHSNDLRFRKALQMFSISAVSSCLIRDFCHPDNKKPYHIRKSEFATYLNQVVPAQCFRDIEWRKLNIRDQILGRLAQMRWFLMIDILVKLYIILRRGNLLKNI